MAGDHEPAPTAYDEIPYPTAVNPHTHPEAIAVLAHLYGLEPPPVETCGVLEVGCGDGGNLIPMAAGLPLARFHGFDLASSVIAQGRADVAALGLTNIPLETADLMEVAERSEQYDYIIAHGFYTWVPEFVREGLLRLFERALAPGGFVIMSFNVTQGCHIRRMLREATLFQMRLTGVERKDLAGVAAIFDFIAEGAQDDQPYGQALKTEAQLWRSIGPGVALHDILSPDYASYRFHEVTGRLADHGLDYLGEGDSYALRRELFPAELEREVHRRAGGDPVMIEEIYDDLHARPFRLSIFRKRAAGAEAWRRPKPTGATVGAMHVVLASEVSADKLMGDVHDGEWLISVRARDGAKARIGGQGLRQILQRLCDVAPRSVAVDEFGTSPQVVNAFALLHSIGLVRLLTRPSSAVGEVSPHPRAFPPAALYASKGAYRLPRTDHALVDLDPSYAQLLTLLDGRRTHGDIAAAAAEMFGATVEVQGERLPRDLEVLARAGVLDG